MTFIKFLLLQIVKFIQFNLIFTHLHGCPQKTNAWKYWLRISYYLIHVLNAPCLWLAYEIWLKSDLEWHLILNATVIEGE